jgi:hypothetical protein
MGVCEFGLTPDDAWRLTLPEINQLANYAEIKEHNKYYRAAMIVSAIYNVNRDTTKRKEPYTPEDILGESKQGSEEEKLVEKAKVLTEFFGGEVRDGV